MRTSADDTHGNRLDVSRSTHFARDAEPFYLCRWPAMTENDNKGTTVHTKPEKFELKRSFISLVRPTAVHINPSRKRSFSVENALQTAVGI